MRDWELVDAEMRAFTNELLDLMKKHKVRFVKSDPCCDCENSLSAYFFINRNAHSAKLLESDLAFAIKKVNNE